MKRAIIIFIILLGSNTIEADQPVQADRWLEIDLYWFKPDNLEKSAIAFWERYSPLMDGINGWKGVILNVGWISDYILEWQGDLNQEIVFPKGMKSWGWFKDEGQLSGTSTERTIKEWIDDQTGTLIKWPVPVLSVTRTEYLPHVESDLFIFQTPVHLNPVEKESIIKIMAGNLEEGINHTADHAVSAVINLPWLAEQNQATAVSESWNGTKNIIGRPTRLHIHLEQAQTKLYIIK